VFEGILLYFILFFLHFKYTFHIILYIHVSAYICKITYLTIEYIYIYNYMEITIIGTKARLFGYTNISNGP
jgi:hypothetical protein